MTDENLKYEDEDKAALEKAEAELKLKYLKLGGERAANALLTGWISFPRGRNGLLDVVSELREEIDTWTLEEEE